MIKHKKDIEDKIMQVQIQTIKNKIEDRDWRNIMQNRNQKKLNHKVQ